MRFIAPKIYVPEHHIQQSGHPLFFLLGPILGGGDWQRLCSELIILRMSRCWIANPCRYPPTHPLMQSLVAGNTAPTFDDQNEWERFYLSLAARHGCIIAWLPCEDANHPRNDGEPYATDTRGEIGEWRGRMMHHETTRFVLGIEAGFPGRKSIVKNMHRALDNDLFPIHNTLEQTVDAAIGMIQASRR